MNEIRCPHCRRYLGTVTTLIGRIQCPACKSWAEFNVEPVDSKVAVAAN